MFTMDDLLEIAIKMEENGEAVYTHAIKKVQGKELISLLTWMANEESSHARWFADLKKNLTLGRNEVHLKEMVPRVLQDMMGEQTLSLGEVDFNKIKTISQLLETFISFEKDTIEFYELLEIFIEKEKIQTGLKKIILEEKKHIEILESMIKSAADHTILK